MHKTTYCSIFAGTTAQVLVDGVTTGTRGAIKGRFFHFYPPREVELLKWLGHWMKKGEIYLKFVCSMCDYTIHTLLLIVIIIKN